MRDPKLKADFPPELYAEVQDSFKELSRVGLFSEHAARDGSGAEAAQTVDRIGGGHWHGDGYYGTTMYFYTEALWRELTRSLDHGMSPMRAITSATQDQCPESSYSHPTLGTIEPGKLADIIVVKGDPLFDIIALADPEIVIKDGVIQKGAPPSPRRTSSPERPQ